MNMPKFSFTHKVENTTVNRRAIESTLKYLAKDFTNYQQIGATIRPNSRSIFGSEPAPLTSWGVRFKPCNYPTDVEDLWENSQLIVKYSEPIIGTEDYNSVSIYRDSETPLKLGLRYPELKLNIKGMLALHAYLGNLLDAIMPTINEATEMLRTEEEEHLLRECREDHAIEEDA